ncbi:hypothetical protein [Methylicorpusculum oleiharenae]|nr:hypothetical protein [Methylicorpusculum oleiharenae]
MSSQAEKKANMSADQTTAGLEHRVTQKREATERQTDWGYMVK